MQETEQTQEQQDTARELAGKIMVYARDELMISMRFLDRALFRMPLIAADSVAAFGVDGETMYYNPEYVLHAFKKEKNACTRAFLHMIFHCIFSHPFQYEKLDRECWDLATDLAVEHVILDLNLQSVKLERDGQMQRILSRLQKQVPILTAEKIYRWLCEHPEKAAEFFREEPLFMWDDHLKWIPVKETQNQDCRNDSITTDTRTAMIGCHEADTGEEGEQEEIDEALVGQRQGEWQEVSQHAKTDLEMFSHEQGFGAGSLLLNLNAALRDKYDYGEFLRKFAVLGEEMHVNDDEFDYIYYTYGLQLYDNMPLVEPLEYRDSTKVQELVIAIDTSMSTSGELVRAFLERTCELLQQNTSFFRRINLRILQCDDKLRSDKVIHDAKEFADYMAHFELIGQSATDFRPVFEHVDRLVAEGAFHSLRGLIYFMDGLGLYPKKRPKYDAAFVMLEGECWPDSVPPWGIRVILREDEILTELSQN